MDGTWLLVPLFFFGLILLSKRIISPSSLASTLPPFSPLDLAAPASTAAPSPEYVPFGTTGAHRQLVVDCSHPHSVCLSHHRNLSPASPLHLKGDSSALCVLNAVRERHPALNLAYVTTNHFDIDSLVSVHLCMAWREMAAWPRERRERREALLVWVSKIGDFRELDEAEPLALEALKVCCWLNTVEKRVFYRPFDGDEREGSPQKFQYFLPLFREVLEDPAAFEEDWREEYDLVLRGVAQLSDPLVTKVERHEDLGLAVISTSEPVHYYALFSKTHGMEAVLSFYSGRRYELEYKYTGYVDITSRPTMPRLETTVLLEVLNLHETHAGSGGEVVQDTGELIWGGSRIVEAGPIIRLDRKGIKLGKAERYGHPYERPIYPSTIPPERLKELVAGFLRHGYYQGHEGRREQVAKTPWLWPEIHQLNSAINWEPWIEQALPSL